jgi:hypothetical protein
MLKETSLLDENKRVKFEYEQYEVHKIAHNWDVGMLHLRNY